MRRKHKLFVIGACLLICLFAVILGTQCNSYPTAKEQKLTVNEIAGAGSEGFSHVWEDGQAVR